MVELHNGCVCCIRGAAQERQKTRGGEYVRLRHHRDHRNLRTSAHSADFRSEEDLEGHYHNEDDPVMMNLGPSPTTKPSSPWMSTRPTKINSMYNYRVQPVGTRLTLSASPRARTRRPKERRLIPADGIAQRLVSKIPRGGRGLGALGVHQAVVMPEEDHGAQAHIVNTGLEGRVDQGAGGQNGSSTSSPRNRRWWREGANEDTEPFRETVGTRTAIGRILDWSRRDAVGPKEDWGDCYEIQRKLEDAEDCRRSLQPPGFDR